MRPASTFSTIQLSNPRDEPLNFIDVYSRMQIEQLIETFSPTMLLVEHDNAFRKAIATQVISL